MNSVIAILREHLREHLIDQNFSFVFPSQISASLWARKVCTLGIVRSLAADRFLAWDRFKEEVIREKETASAEQILRKPATSVIRKFFAGALIRKNAEAPFFKALIQPEYAGGGTVFAPFLARLLPSLHMWEKLKKNAGNGVYKADAEDEDYELIKKEYAVFLERHKLFEPSWEETKIREGAARYVIFFPELIEDFAEYDTLLTAPQFIRVGAETAAASQGRTGLSHVFFQSAREEIRSAVMELQRLHEKEGCPYEDMAVSVPELEEIEPVLTKEFYLRHIPFTRRAGKKLGLTGIGRMFSLINECAANRFSFNSLKALLLNDHIPWKEAETNKALVRFGISYNCVSAYVQDGKTVDIWEEAFKEAYKDSGQRELAGKLMPYYGELKKHIFAMAGAKNFFELRKFYFAFRGETSGRGLLDMEKISAENDAILSRCIEELSSLIELEERFNDPELVPASPFGFFLSCLEEQEYVRANQKPGVNIFKWRVAAASPFTCHFVLNASQSAASVLYQPMKFLRQDKRKALGLEDRDATAAFFLLSKTGEGIEGQTRFSASAQTFSGWAIPHSFFAQGKLSASIESAAPPCLADPYRDERRFWREPGKKKREASLPYAERFLKIFPVQKQSFEFWKNALVQKENNFSFFTSPVPAGPVSELLNKVIPDEDGNLTVTATRDLNVFYNCFLFWLYARVLKAQEFSLEAALLDDTSLGLLYHKILENLFVGIKNEDGAFDARRLDTYKQWAMKITRAAIKEHPAFKGPLAVPLVFPQAAGMSKKITRLLELEAEFFDGYRIAELELPVFLKTGSLLIKGIIDRISISPEGEPVIIDYKTGKPPEQTAIEDLDESCLLEFQMPLYIKLYEEQTGTKTAQGAFFYSINERKIKPVMGKNTGGRIKPPNREEYEPFLKAAENQIEDFARKVTALDFIPSRIQIRGCLGCVYKTVCRTAY